LARLTKRARGIIDSGLPTLLRARSISQASAVMTVRSSRSSLRFLPEIAEIGRLLPLADRHQTPVAAQEIDLVADRDVVVAFGAVVLGPDRLRQATVALDDRPGAGERIVDGRHLVVQDRRVGLVQIDALLDHRLAVLGEGYAGLVEQARHPQV